MAFVSLWDTGNSAERDEACIVRTGANINDQEERIPITMKCTGFMSRPRSCQELIQMPSRRACCLAARVGRTHKQFRQMIRDAEDLGDFKAILCWDQDRLDASIRLKKANGYRHCDVSACNW